jgi:hypothetical protein
LLDRLFPPPRAFAVRLWDEITLPASADPAFTLVLIHPHALRRMFMPPIERALGEAFIDGDFDVDGDPFATVALLLVPLRYGKRLLRAVAWQPTVLKTWRQRRRLDSICHIVAMDASGLVVQRSLSSGSGGTQRTTRNYLCGPEIAL